VEVVALAHNVQQLKSLYRCKPVVGGKKTDAYGHGTVATTVLQSGASWLGVATVPEELN